VMLALDCERLSATWAAVYLRDHYRLLSADPCSDEVFDFYMALRAVTQAKLAIWHLDDPEHSRDPAPWRERALSAIATALGHCHSPMVAPAT